MALHPNKYRRNDCTADRQMNQHRKVTSGTVRLVSDLQRGLPRSAAGVRVAAVEQALCRYPTKNVTVVGHSLGGLHRHRRSFLCSFTHLHSLSQRCGNCAPGCRVPPAPLSLGCYRALRRIHLAPGKPSPHSPARICHDAPAHRITAVSLQVGNQAFAEYVDSQDFSATRTTSRTLCPSSPLWSS